MFALLLLLLFLFFAQGTSFPRGSEIIIIAQSFIQVCWTAV